MKRVQNSLLKNDIVYPLGMSRSQDILKSMFFAFAF